MSRREEFAELVHARSGALHRAAYLMVGDAGLAQDLVQEALVKTYAAWPRLREPAKAEAYCRKAITTTAISWFRRRSWREAQTAEALGCAVGTFKSQVAAGLTKLRERLGDDPELVSALPLPDFPTTPAVNR